VRTISRQQVPVRCLQLAITAVAATLALPAGTASAAPAPLHIASTVAVPGVAPSGPAGPAVSAEAPDGSVYVASLAGGQQSVYVVSTTGVVHLADRVTGVGAITAVAADASYLYVGSAHAVTAYLRSNGGLAQRWTFSPSPRAVSQVAVAGNRVWGLLTPHGNTTSSSLVELDPTSPVRVATVNGIQNALSIAATPSAVFYVTDTGSSFVRLTNAGVKTTAKTHLTVNQTLSGPSAVQAVLVQGNHLIVRFAAGQGLDAVTYVYNATTLAGPGSPAAFDAESSLGNTTSLGLLDVAAADSAPCPGGVHPCVVRYAVGSGGPILPALTLPYEQAGAPLGPFAAVVATSGSHQSVLRIG
jgi:hypothetical protein